jgi:uncharacterized protein YgiM (DUF1202 family)
MSTRGAFSRRRFMAHAAGVAALAATGSLAIAQPGSARSTDTLIVNSNGSRLRSGAGTRYSVVTTLAKGTEVQYLSNGGTVNGYTWYKVKVLKTGKQGYIASILVAAPGTTPPPAGDPGFPPNVTVTRGPLNVRQYPGLSYGVVATVAQGAKGWLTQRTFVKADGHLWAEVTFKVGSRYITGYVSSSFVSIT